MRGYGAVNVHRADTMEKSHHPHVSREAQERQFVTSPEQPPAVESRLVGRVDAVTVGQAGDLVVEVRGLGVAGVAGDEVAAADGARRDAIADASASGRVAAASEDEHPRGSGGSPRGDVTEARRDF